MKRSLLYLGALLFWVGVVRGVALGGQRYVSFGSSAGSMALVQSRRAAPIFVADDDWPGVRRAAQDLANDIDRVTAVRPTLRSSFEGQVPPEAILTGTLGHSRLIDGLVARGKLDVSSIKGRWEMAITVVVNDPLPGLSRALVIVGSDKRGTIFGIYDLSEQMGVSPWYWWADVPTVHHDELFVQPGRVMQPEPAVRYRGIFLNDEAPCLTGWTQEKFGGRNSAFYAHVFELLLRLRANYLWPAMWSSAFNEDDPRNAALADEYGIVMGTSHHEPMLRSQQEWKRHGTGEWNYATNGKELHEFWRAGVERNRNFESTVTLGMRGDGDKPMSASDDVGLLEQVIQDQLAILKQESTPTLEHDLKIWALYKEVQSYYEKGMRVPDDVTLLWSDDNWGNLRRLPTPAERGRSGGAGVYYHLDYVGGPRSYKWINTYPISKIQEQMHLALSYGADRVWIVNVGDLKPLEFPLEFFLNYAREPQRWGAKDLQAYTVAWATREFGPVHALTIADAMDRYTRYLGRRKPEQLDAHTFSLTHFEEADRVDAEWQALRREVDALLPQLPAEERSAFFELVQYPVDAGANLNAMYVALARNQLAATFHLADTNVYAQEVRERFAEDRQLADAYNALLNGRWHHMMDQSHIGYTSWNDPPANILPAVATIDVPAAGAMLAGVGEQFGAKLDLGEFDSAGHERKTLTLANTGRSPVHYEVTAGAPWVLLEKRSGKAQGTVTGHAALAVSIDWAHAPAGLAEATLEIRSDAGTVSTVRLRARHVDLPAEAAGAFVESDGYIAMEAAHTTGRTAGGGVSWSDLPGFGRSGSAVTVAPVDAPSEPQSAAGTSYRVFTTEGGSMRLQCQLAPTLNFVPGRGLRFAVSVDDGPRTVVDALADGSDRAWSKAVSDGVRTVEAPLDLGRPGVHTLHVWYVDPGVVLERLVLARHALPYSYLGPPESVRAGTAAAEREDAPL